MVKNPLASIVDAENVGLIPGWGRSLGVRNDNPLSFFSFLFFKKCIYFNRRLITLQSSGPITSWEIDEETVETESVRLYFGGAPKSLQMVIAAMKLKDTYSLEEKL